MRQLKLIHADGRRVSHVVMIGLLLLLIGVTPARALDPNVLLEEDYWQSVSVETYDTTWSCDEFETRNIAQYYFDLDSYGFSHLDADGDGIPCEHLPYKQEGGALKASLFSLWFAALVYAAYKRKTIADSGLAQYASAEAIAAALIGSLPLAFAASIIDSRIPYDASLAVLLGLTFGGGAFAVTAVLYLERKLQEKQKKVDEWRAEDAERARYRRVMANYEWHRSDCDLLIEQANAFLSKRKSYAHASFAPLRKALKNSPFIEKGISADGLLEFLPTKAPKVLIRVEIVDGRYKHYVDDIE